MTACDLQKSFSFDKTFEITSHEHFPIDVQTYIIVKIYYIKIYYISRDVGVRNALNDKSNFQGHSRSLVLVPFDKPHTNFYYIATTQLQYICNTILQYIATMQLCFYLVPFPGYYQ